MTIYLLHLEYNRKPPKDWTAPKIQKIYNVKGSVASYFKMHTK